MLRKPITGKHRADEPICDPPLSFGCNFTREQMAGIVSCANTYHLFFSVCMEDMEALFACKEGFHIRVNNLRRVVVLFDALLENSLIQSRWQAVLDKGRFLQSKDGTRFVSASSLSSALSVARSHADGLLYLTDSQFFRNINEEDKYPDYNSSYREFSEMLFHYYRECSDNWELFLTLIYTENELIALSDFRSYSGSGVRKLYIHKATLLVRYILELMKAQLLPLFVANVKYRSSSFHWTGSHIELVELIYGLQEMRSINDGETPIHELAAFMGTLFAVDIRDCYSAYTDMKRRKNDSRTYFLDKMREKLNRRMERDDEKTPQRR